MLLMRKNNHLTRKIYHFYKVTDKNISIFISFNSFFTYVFQYTSLTMRCCPRRTDVSSVPYKSVAEITSLFSRYYLPQLHLNFFRVFYSINKPHPVYKAYAMSICHYRWLFKHVTHYMICTFSSHSRKF